MTETETIKQVPNGDVKGIEAEYKMEGWTVVVTPNSDGKTSTVVATKAS